MKKMKGLTKIGTIAYHIGMFSQKDGNWKFRWLHPLTILFLVPSALASVFFDGFRNIPDLIEELKRDGCLW